MESNYGSWIAYLSRSWPDEIEIRKAFQTFFHLYPLDNAQWLRYGREMQRVSSSAKSVQEVYDLALESCPFSPELWVDYFTFMIDNQTKSKGIHIEAFMERASTYMIGHPDASSFWMLAFHLLQCHGDLLLLMHYYLAVLSVPSPYVNDMHESFKKIKEAITLSEPVPIEFRPLSNEDSAHLTNLMSKIDDMYRQSVDGWISRQPFEQALKRRTYLEAPVPRDEINSWHEYLTFEQRQERQRRQHKDSFERVDRKANECCPMLRFRPMDRCVMLFERCLMPCAGYPGKAFLVQLQSTMKTISNIAIALA